MNLKEANIGQTVKVVKLGGDGAIRQHFLDMGIIPETEITLMKYAPLGDPVELRLHGYELTLRLDDAEKIEVVPVTESPKATVKKHGKKSHEHPGLGEGGKFHAKGDGNPLPEGTIMKFALVGNQN
ncbi:MAG TPA: ferrous iron transporter B, partial [Ruminococcus sp.]|nr:ferrous iron transporter B [Ruminococcus sp.]